MLLKAARALPQPRVPSWGSGTLLLPLGTDGEVKAQGDQLAWPVTLGTSAGAYFDRYFGHAFVTFSKNPIYISASSQGHIRYGPPRSWCLPSAVGH